MKLKDCYITAAVRCAPPLNKPTKKEFDKCRPYLLEELKLLKNIHVVVALGKIAFDSFLKAYHEIGGSVPKPRPKFGHGALTQIADSLLLIGSYHPSQQNTFTGKLTREMFEGVFRKTKEVLSAED